ncbi:MAG TPA: hypothetical protein VGO57_01655 [Verrucomicrobiae bacterium]|jgi:hypothetical protein
MKSPTNITGWRLPKLLLGLVMVHFSLSVLAQSYSINWHQIPGGGGTSSGGSFTLSGSIGQHDAGSTMSGGSYQLTGGFWSVVAVQTPGAPLLTISHSGNQIIISWPAAATGWTLQTNNNLTTSSWGNYSGTVVNNSVTNPPAQANLFFRLKQ